MKSRTKKKHVLLLALFFLPVLALPIFSSETPTEARERLLNAFHEKGAGAVPELIDALEHETQIASRTAAHLLVRIGEEAKEGLSKGLQHSDFKLRRIIVDGLAEQGLIENYWPEILMDAHPSIRKDVLLFHLKDHPVPSGQVLDEIIKRFSKEYETADADLRLHIAEILAEFTPLPVNARSILEKATQDPESEVREIALSAIMDTREALFFDGEESFVEADEPVLLGSGNFTYEIWFMPYHSSGRQVLMGSGRGDHPGRPGINLSYDYPRRSISVRASNNKDNTSLSHSDISAASPEQWTHVAFVVDRSDKAELFVNGILVSEADATGFGDDDGFDAGPFRIGRRPHSPLWFFHGAINEVRVWRRALSRPEIHDNMKTTLSGDEDGLLLYWSMNEGRGDIVHDKTQNKNHGIVNEASWLIH